MTCRKCRVEIPDESKFCLHCGANQNPTRTRRKRGNGQGTVYKTKSGKYQLEIHEPERRTKGGFATMKEAWAYMPTLAALPLKKEREAAARQDAVRRAKDRSNDTFAQLYETWLLRHADRVTKDTLYCYKSAYNHFEGIHPIRFRDLNTEDFQLCVDDCPKGKRTRENMKALGTLLYKYAAELNITDKNYAKHIYIGHMETESRKSFPSEIVAKLLKAAEEGVPYAGHVAAMCYLGYRPTELLDLQRDHYRTDTKSFVGGIKTEAGKSRVVPVSPKIQAIINRQLIKASPYVFPSTDGAHLDERRFREECFYPLLVALKIQPLPDPKNGVKPTYTPYSCRHTFATMMKNVKGAAIDKASLMGHTSYEMTLHYQDEDIDSLRAIVDAL